MAVWRYTHNMKARDLMTNNASDKFAVFVGAKKNYVNQWTCESLKNAELSVELFKEENPNKDRNFAIIKDNKTWVTLKKITL